MLPAVRSRIFLPLHSRPPHSRPECIPVGGLKFSSLCIHIRPVLEQQLHDGLMTSI
jgi:hypothetical protein